MTVTAPSSDPVIGFQRRKSLVEVVDELLKGVREQVPVDHVCRPTRWQQCSHSVGARTSLLDRLDELSMPAQEMMPAPDAPSMIRSVGGRSMLTRGARAGSPAPWASSAAELLDEILRGALQCQREARVALELEPFTVAVLRPVWPRSARPQLGPVHADLWCGHGSCRSIAEVEVARVSGSSVALADAGRHALRGLPGLARLLADADHPLGVRIRGERDIRTQGKLEERVRGWHQRVLTLIGHNLPLERLPQLPNPDHRRSDVDWLPEFGPVCESLLCGHPSCASIRWPPTPGRRLGPVCASCSHASCRRIRAAGRRWLTWLCPSCWADSLRRDPVADEVHCLRASCVDEDGDRSSWPMAALQEGSADPWGDRV